MTGPWLTRILAGAVVVMVVAAGFLALPERPKVVVAYFPQVKGMYVGDHVTVLGVQIGEITAIDPQRDKVRVEMEIDPDQKLPADVRAAQVAGSLVSIRAVALGPVYTGGATFPAGGTIPMSRTSVPVEWDEMKDQLVRLSTALGPNKSNKNGSLSEFLGASAKYLDGNGDNIRLTIDKLSEALSTLADNKGDLFATVRNLQVFVTALESADSDVRSFNTRLADVSDVLADNRKSLAQALEQLAAAFTEVQAFLKENRVVTTETVHEVRTVTSMLADNRQTLADLLQIAPGTVSNFHNIEDSRYPGMSGHVVLNNLADPATFLCTSLYAFAGEAGPGLCEQVLSPVLDYFKTSPPPIGLFPPPNNGGAPGDVVNPDGTPVVQAAPSGQSQIAQPSESGSAGPSATDNADIIREVQRLLKLGGSR